jgi:hypothetical protein
MKRWVLAGALLVSGILPAACGLPPMVSDTGYKGTWRRGTGPQGSIVAITQVGDRWYFRWTMRDPAGRRSVLCDWEGRCEERYKDQPVATYTISSRLDPATGKLTTDTVEERVAPERKTFRYTDVLELADEGRTLVNFTTDRDGSHFEGAARPRRSFAKISNSIADPPRAQRP